MSKKLFKTKKKFKGKLKDYDDKSSKMESKLKGKKTNDIAWHTKNAQTVQDLMSYPFNTIVGRAFGISKSMSVGTRDVCVCGYASLMSMDADWFLGISKADDPNSTINISADNLYAFMRKYQSGSSNYQDTDLWTTVFAGTLDILANIAYLDKIFGLVDDFSNRNRLRPKLIFSSMNLDYDHFVQNLANLRARYNTIKAKATSLVMPKEYPIADQLISLYGDIHIDYDTDTGREQIINIVKPYHHIYDATSDSNGGKVRCVLVKDLNPVSTNVDAIYTGLIESGDTYELTDITNNAITGRMRVSLLLDILDLQINALITDDDYNIMAGDIMKAFDKYGQGDFWSFKPTDADHKISITYSEEFNKMIHNSAIIPHVAGYNTATTEKGEIVGYTHYYTNQLRQTPDGYLVVDWASTSIMPDAVLAYAQKGHECDMIIDSDAVNPSPEEVLLITRWQNRYNVNVSAPASGKSTVIFTPKTMSSVILSNARIFYNTEWNQGAPNSYVGLLHCPLLQFMNAGWIVKSPAWVLQQMFDNGPISYLDIDNQATISNTLREQWMIGRDLNNAVAMTNEVLQRANEVDFMSLLNVPFGKSF